MKLPQIKMNIVDDAVSAIYRKLNVATSKKGTADYDDITVNIKVNMSMDVTGVCLLDAKGNTIEVLRVEHYS